MNRLDPRGIERLRRTVDAPDLEGDRYEVIEPLGRGGMGTVYLADDRLLGRRVALKVLHLEDLSDEGIERMTREARTLARLEHPGIVPIHDLGRLPDGRVYYAMKQVRGERLDRVAASGTPLAERLRLFLKLCEAVSFAHAAGVVHRDLKPENVMVGEFGEVLILDWGVARWLADERAERPARDGSSPAHDPERTAPDAAPPAAPAPDTPDRITHDGAVIGTPAWMAPEQARGEIDRVDRVSDVYALGGLLHFLATGRPPRGAADAAAAAIEPGPPAPLAAICARALAPAPAARYPSAGELAADVQRYLEGVRPLAHQEGALDRVVRFVRRHRVAVGLVAAYLLVRAIMAAFLRR